MATTATPSRASSAAMNSPLYAGRRRRNAIAKGLAYAATAFGLGWLVCQIGSNAAQAALNAVMSDLVLARSSQSR